MKGHILIKLYKVAEPYPITTTKNSSYKCCTAMLCNNIINYCYDNEKDLTFHVTLKDPSLRLVSSLSTFQSPFVDYNYSRNIFWG